MPRDFAKPIEKDPLQTELESPPRGNGKFPWWVALLIGLLLINAALMAYFMFSGSEEKKPTLEELLAEREAYEAISEEQDKADESVEEPPALPSSKDVGLPEKEEEPAKEKDTEYEFYNWLAEENHNDDDVVREPAREVFKAPPVMTKPGTQAKQHNQTAPDVPSTPSTPSVVTAELPSEQLPEQTVLDSENQTFTLTTDIQPEEAPQVEETQPAKPLVRYSLQVGSFQKLDDAKRHLEFLDSKGFEAYTYQAQINDKTWNRVVVGNFDSRETMEEARNVLKELGIDSLLIPIKD